MTSGTKAATSRFFPETMSQSAKAYITSITCLGLALFAYSLYVSAAHEDLRWLYLVGLTVVTGCLAIRIPLLKGKTQSLSISISDIFIFGAMLLFNPAVAAVVAVAEGFVVNLRQKTQRAYKQLFNLAQLSLAAFAVGQLFYLLDGRPAPLDPAQVSGVERLLVEVAVCALAYFVLNSGVVATAMALVTGQPLVTLWKRNFLWASPASFANAFCALIVYLCFKQVGFAVAVVIIPPALVMYVAQKVSALRVRQAELS